MASTGLLETVNMYTRREADLTNQLSDIVLSINRASADSLKLLDETSSNKAAVREEYEAGSDAYKEAMAEVQDDYEYGLAVINQWESELTFEKENLETQIKATTIAKEGFQAALKQNVTKDHQYGGTGGTGG